MAKPHERVFAFVGALLFLATSVAVAVVVVWQAKQERKVQEQALANQNQTQNPTDPASQTCMIQQVPGKTEKKPQASKVAVPVAELKTETINEGSGEAAKPGDCLIVKYLGILAKDTSEFDGNFDTEQALQFQVGTGQVIPGWDQGMLGLKVGGTRRLIIPATLAYKEDERPGIPPNSDLVFVVKLIDIKK